MLHHLLRGIKKQTLSCRASPSVGWCSARRLHITICIAKREKNEGKREKPLLSASPIRTDKYFHKGRFLLSLSLSHMHKTPPLIDPIYLLRYSQKRRFPNSKIQIRSKKKARSMPIPDFTIHSSNVIFHMTTSTVA